MSHSAPPEKGRYGPTQEPGIKSEAGGFTVLCTCRWTRWWPRKSDASEGRLKHQKACKKSGESE